MEELKKVFPNAEIEVKVDNERLTQYGVTIPLYAPINVEVITKIDRCAAIVAMDNGIYISLIIEK